MNYGNQLINNLKAPMPVKNRYEELCNFLQLADSWKKMGFRESDELLDNLATLIKFEKKLFPSLSEFFEVAVTKKYLEAIVFLQDQMSFDIHEARLANGRSALHHFVDEWHRQLRSNNRISFSVKHMIRFLLDNCEENSSDAHGFTYLHGACTMGHLRAIEKFTHDGASVNVDAYKYTALHLAALNRHEDAVRLLLEKGADPNRPAHGGTMPLHALAQLHVSDHREPVITKSTSDAIVDLLVKNGAKIEARNKRGLTPLEWAVSRLDLDLAKSLVSHGANVLHMRPDKMFGHVKFTDEKSRKCNVILPFAEIVQFLASTGFMTDLKIRLEILKFWKQTRGSDENYLMINDEVISQLPMQHKWYKRDVTNELARMKGIMLTENVSLYGICQMSYRRASLVLSKIEDFRLPQLGPQLEGSVKRHIASIMMRPQFELLAADLFGTARCNLKLPYTACRIIAKYMGDDDLYRLCELTSKNDAVKAKERSESSVRLSAIDK